VAKGEKEIRRRIRSVKNTQQITRAMKMVASAKLQKSQGRTKSAQPYAMTLTRLVDHLVRWLGDLDHPLLRPTTAEAQRVILIVFTSDKGLCGAFNTNLVRRAELFMRNRPEQEFELVTIGRYAERYFRYRGYRIHKSLPAYDFDTHFLEMTPLFELVERAYLSGEFTQIWVLYSRFVSTVRQQATMLQLLPLEHRGLAEQVGESEPAVPRRQAAAEHLTIDLIFEPSPQRVLETLLPRFVRYSLYQAMRENFTSENAARMLAMDNATKNASEMIRSLTLAYHKARQQSITAELLDIVGGAEAQQG